MYEFLPEPDRQILMEAQKNKGFIKHDYTNPVHFAFLMNRLGGEECVKKSYPSVYNAALNAKKRASKRGVQKERPEYAEGNTDKMIIERVECSSRELKVACHASFVKEKPMVSIQTEVYDQNTGKFLTGSDSEKQNSFCLSTLDSHNISQFVDKKKDMHLLSVAHFFYTEEDKYGDPYIASATEIRDEAKILADDLVEEFEVSDPIIGKRGPTERTKIVVVYNRESQVKDDYDYNSKKPVKDNKLPIELPVGAYVKVNPYHQIAGLYEDFGAQLYLEDLSEGTTEYYGEPEILQTDERTLRWNYAADWKRVLDISGCNVYTVVRIYCRVCLKITDDKGENPRPVWFTFQSVPLEEQGHIGEAGDITINNHPVIKFQWGCMGKDSMVRMGDGSLKRICEVKPGDRVFVFREEGNGVETVADVYCGIEPEEKLINLTLEDGKMLLLTEDHPVKTERGIIRMRQVVLGDKVYTEDGYRAIRYLYFEEYKDKSYNLELEKSGMLSCNGIVAGDFEEQQRCRVRPGQEKRLFSKEMNQLQKELSEIFESRRKEKK